MPKDVWAEFTDSDTRALLDLELEDPENGNALIDFSTFTARQLYGKGKQTNQTFGPISGTPQSPATKCRFDCATVAALGPDHYVVQCALTDASGVQRSSDGLIVVKEKV